VKKSGEREALSAMKQPVNVSEGVVEARPVTACEKGSTLQEPVELSWQPRKLLAFAAGLALAAVVVAPMDVRVAAWFRHSRLPGDLGKALMLSEAFAHGAGAAVILLAAWLLDEQLHGRGGRRRLVAVLVGALGGGLVTDVIKTLVDRVRPRALDFSAVQTTLATFAAPDGLGGADLHSFPSGHSAVAAGMACTLAVLQPRGRWLFAAVGAMACLQRLVVSAHYPSDVACGAAIGVAMAGLCAGQMRRETPLPRRFGAEGSAAA
jgi:membrane-associated phospholipid phosphatase